MGFDAENGDEASNSKLQRLAAQARAFRSTDEDDDDSNDISDEEILQSPIDESLANGVAQHAEQRRVEIEKEKLEKASASAAAS